MKTIAQILAVSLTVVACAGATKEESLATADTAEALSNATPSDPLHDLYSDGATKLIKRAHYRFQVKDVKKSTEAIEMAVRKFPAYISSSALTLENPTLENKLTLKVQNQYFHDLLKEIDKEATFVNFRNISTDDVSKQFVDLESRLKAKREVEQRLMDILRNKTGNVKDVLEAEKQIGELHEEIEAVVSRINYLKDQVSYSTIDLEFYQIITEVIAESESTFLNDIKTAAKSGIDGVASFVVAVVYIWPLVIMAVAIGFWIRRRRMFFLRFKS